MDGHYECAYNGGAYVPMEKASVVAMLRFYREPVERKLAVMKAGGEYRSPVATVRWMPGPAPMVTEMVEA